MEGGGLEMGCGDRYGPFTAFWVLHMVGVEGQYSVHTHKLQSNLGVVTALHNCTSSRQSDSVVKQDSSMVIYVPGGPHIA